jgi:pimeloyl-ACP methyl ester carboxylesterase
MQKQLNMHFLKKDNVALAYEDTNTDLPPLVLVHGCGLDHRSLTRQTKFFSRSHRVISVDLRGHGESDAPYQDYTMAAFAEDLAWLCTELTLVKPIVVGHSMGGNVALELAARYPEVLSSLVMIDSVVLPPQALLDTLPSQFAEALAGPHYLDAYRQSLSALCLPTDKQSLQLISSLDIPKHVLVSALPNHTTNYDASSAATACHVPIAYIFSIMPFLDLPRFESLTPQLVSARTLGSGHFSPVEVPDQVNAMIAQFIKVSMKM